MKNTLLQTALPTDLVQLKAKLQHILYRENLQDQRALLAALATELAVDVLDCGAALLHIIQLEGHATSLPSGGKLNFPLSKATRGDTPVLKVCTLPSNAEDCVLEPTLPLGQVTLPIKMLRYRLDIGKKHQLTVKELKKVLVEESGVDINNINNVMIHGEYTLIELPDEMPQDIFQHLKTVEINQQKLNIKRLKSRTKKQANNRFRRGKPRVSQRNSNDSA